MATNPIPPPDLGLTPADWSSFDESIRAGRVIPVVGPGRDDWVGWLDLKKETVKATADPYSLTREYLQHQTNQALMEFAKRGNTNTVVVLANMGSIAPLVNIPAPSQKANPGQ